MTGERGKLRPDHFDPPFTPIEIEGAIYVIAEGGTLFIGNQADNDPVALADRAKALTVTALKEKRDREKRQCWCLECRIRAVVIGETATAAQFVDTTPTIKALGEVMAEMLAHYPTHDIKRFAAALISAARKWKKDPRVAVQHTQGNA